MTTLAELRAEIDEIDDALHDLLVRRVEIGRRVALAKAAGGDMGAPGGTSIANLRPGREAAIVHRLAARNRPPLEVSTLVAIWRQILAANLGQQTEISVAVPVGAGLDATAWSHCGTVARVMEVDGTDEALDAVASGRTLVAVLPGLDRVDAWRWWPGLLTSRADNGKPRVIARLPLFEPGPTDLATDAFVVAAIMPEASGDDRSLFAIAPGGSSNAVLDTDPVGGWSLVEMDGFTDYPSGLPEGHGWVHVGAYAAPIPRA